MFSRTKVIEFTNTLSPWLFLDNVSFEHLHQVISGEQEHHHEHEQFDTIWLKTDTVLNQVAFQKFMQTLPTSVLRSKGVVALRQADGTVVKMLVQYIGARLQFMQSTWQEGEKQGSAMLFIGTGIDNDALEKGFQACAS
jgi:G3E family GTPase